MGETMIGKVCLLTGAGGTKGLALGRLLSEEGAKVIISDIDEDAAKANASQLGRDAGYVKLDVTLEPDWQSAVHKISGDYARLDLLVNSARVHTRNRDLTTTSLESWRLQTSVNLDGAFLGMKNCLPLLRITPASAIVNVVSISAIDPFAPTPAYSASHAALLNLTKTTAVNCARANNDIRVNAVVCGMSSNSPVGEIAEVARRLIPLGRPAVAEDIANAILWLASDRSRYVTGSSITLDGGYTAEGLPGA